MAHISMDAHGRFGNLFKAAANAKGVSLDEIAEKTDYTYEQMRKIVRGTSLPSDDLLRVICKYLGLDYNDAKQAATADRMEKRYGTKEAYAVMGKNPRLADIEPFLPHLDENEWRMFVAQIAGYVRERARGQKKSNG